MPKDYEHRVFYENLYKEKSLKLLESQQESGLWNRSLLYLERFDYK